MMQEKSEAVSEISRLLRAPSGCPRRPQRGRHTGLPDVSQELGAAAAHREAQRDESVPRNLHFRCREVAVCVVLPCKGHTLDEIPPLFFASLPDDSGV
jgi:hypothetical protein